MALATPLQVPEVLAIAWSQHYTWGGFWNWTSQALDPSPLAYLIQLPFVLLFGASRLGPRIPALLFALASCFLFLRLVQRAVPKRRYESLLLFMLLPVQLFAVTATTQYETSLFFVLLATISFFTLVARPGYKTATLFALATAACLFTDHHSALPAFGAVLFLLRFSSGPQERKAVWFALAGCVAAVVPYVPYYIWVRSHTSPVWLTEPSLSLHTFVAFTPVEWALAVGVLLLLAGTIAGAIVSFRLPLNQVRRRVTLFCLFGSVVVTLTLFIVIAIFTLSPIAIRELLYAVPGVVILFIATLDWLIQILLVRSFRIALPAVGIAVVAVCALADLQFAMAPKGNLALESGYVAPELTGDSCLVFVSERYSKPLFLVFQPHLDARECTDFFHHRIVLASHPYVGPDQQADAEGFFRGLNFSETRRLRSGGGEIVVMESGTR
jgi:hypothetical protein